MKILQKKGFQLREQGKEIGRTSFLQTKKKRIGRSRKKSTLKLADARMTLAWESLPEAKKAKILAKAGWKEGQASSRGEALQENAENKQVFYSEEPLAIQEIGEEPLLYESETLPFREKPAPDAFDSYFQRRQEKARKAGTGASDLQLYGGRSPQNGGQLAAGGAAPKIPQAMEEMRKTASAYAGTDASAKERSEEETYSFSNRETHRKKETAQNTGQTTRNEKAKRRIMRKMSRKMAVSEVFAEPRKEEETSQANRSLSEKAMTAAEKGVKAALKSLGRNLAALAAAFPPVGLFLILCFFLIAILASVCGIQQSLSARAVNLSPEVEAYRATVQEIARDYNMSEYVELLLAVMMQESGGQGNDPMQASEGGYNIRYPRVPNGITDPLYSIECGVQELRNALSRADVSSPTDMTNIRIALQGYNFGPGYVTWFRNKGYTEWSFETACEFAESTGWGRRSDPNHPAGPWKYGDQYYPEHVLRYYTVSSGSADLPENGLPIPIYYQWEYQNAYGSSTIAQAGCGPSCFAMVVSYLRGETITPADVVAWCGNAYYVPGAGTSWSFFSGAAEHYGIGAVATTTSAEAVMNALREGRPVISSQSPGLFTRGGHFIVLRGITQEGKILVNDPNDNDRKQYLNRQFDMYSEIHCTSRCYWIFEPKQ